MRLGLQHNRDDHLLIEVEDTGCGISEENQTKLFKPFTQLSQSGTKKQEGAGLGLAITKQIVQLMKGELTVASALGIGSTFRIDLPVHLPSTDMIRSIVGARGEVTGLAPGQPTYRVLVADSHADSRLLMARLLTDVGFEVQLIDDDKGILANFSHWLPDFVFIDQSMLTKNGLEVIRQIRALPVSKKIKIAVITTFVFSEDESDRLAGHFDVVLYKPFRSDQLYGCMEQLLNVCFVRDNPRSQEPIVSYQITQSSLAALPEDIRKQLQNALKLLNRERIMAIIDNIDQIDPALAQALRLQISDYDYSTILSLLDG